jgi:bla regulator protein blaR1
LLAIWALGFTFVLVRWGLCWLGARAVLRTATPYPMDIGIEVRLSSELREPGIFGIYRPALLLPSAIVSRLTPAELEAVIAHELCHVRHRDNLTAAIHMLVEALFWYFPVAWWIGRQMLKEREHACDECVIEHGAAPCIYAEGILKACRLSLESRLGVVAAAGGSNLMHRVEAIVSGQPARRLNHSGQAGLALIAAGSVILPLLAGFAMPLPARSSPPLAAVHTHDSQHFASAWIEPTAGHNRVEPRLALTATQLSMQNTSLRKLISVASGLSERQVFGGPVWLDERYDIEATARSPITRRMILDLLTEQFGLRFVEQNLPSSTDPL